MMYCSVERAASNFDSCQNCESSSHKHLSVVLNNILSFIHRDNKNISDIFLMHGDI